MIGSKSFAQLLDAWREFVRGTAYPTPAPYIGPDVRINRLIEDSRAIRPGDCFVARVRRGYSDGHPYIPAAIAAGAALIVAQADADLPPLPPGAPPIYRVPDSALTEAWLAAAWYDFPAANMTVIGVTGTDGKTSITNLLYAILQTAGHKTGMISTIKAVIGNYEEPTGLHVTTPQAPEIQALLRRMADDGVTHCVLEATSMGLAEYRADTAFFDIAVISNVQHEHLDYHGGWENYMAAKARLFELAEVAIVNADDRSYPYLETVDADYRLAYGIDRPEVCQIWAEQIRFAADATRFVIEMGVPGQRALPLPIKTSLLGRFNVYNMLAAAAAAHALEIDNATIKAGLESVDGISGRMERIDSGQPFLVVVDFAHTPNALVRAIEAARGMTGGRIITVFGSAGRRDVAKRRMMAELSAQHADLTVLTAEDPRQEPLDAILAMMAEGCNLHGGVEGETFWRIADRGRAIYHGLTLAQPNDLVLICGKGHEQSMCFGTTEYAWDDRDATRAALQAFLSGSAMPDLGLPTFAVD